MMASNLKRLTVFEMDMPKDKACMQRASSGREDMTDQPKPDPTLIPPHGGYRDLKSYQMAEIVFDATMVFCDRFIDKRSRTNDQMVQAARSGKQNIAEGSMASGTSRKTELKLVGVARASLEELLLDFQDFLRQKGLPFGEKSTRKRGKFERWRIGPIGLIRPIRPILKLQPKWPPIPRSA
jgi:four helix bundle protein